MNNNHLNFHFFALGAFGKGISGGDRIFIELARRWSKNYPVSIYLWTEGYQMCQGQNLNSSKIKYYVSTMEPWRRLGFAVNYFARTLEAIKIALQLKLENNPSTIVYSASDFPMDSLPGWILKLRYPKITWIGTYYLAAPNPCKGFDEQENVKLKIPKFGVLIFWLQQQPIYQILKSTADFIFLTSEPDIKRFPKHKDRCFVIQGGVNLDQVKDYQKKYPGGKSGEKIYDAVFQGRFHPQKGVLELVDIWRQVVDQRPQAKLAMIGDGPLMADVKTKIKRLHLDKNIHLFGYVFDGSNKYQIFDQSKIVVHPAIYDSGGMAAAEAMAFGLPAISFDLNALKTYYPKGMLKVPLGNEKKFAQTVLKLLEDKKLYEKTKQEAEELINKYWDWDKRAEETLAFLT